ncbi:hypothetical protein BH20ACI1_BH20ACI1_10480 [soil metagenome]
MTNSRAFQSPGSWQVFYGVGAVRFAKGATSEINLAWYLGTAGGDATDALNKIIASLNFSAGGNVFIPRALWTTTGGHDLPTNTLIRGGNSSVNAINDSQIKLVSSNTYIFKISGNVREVSIKRLTLSSAGDTAATATVGILATSSYPNSTLGCYFEDVVFYGFTDTAFKVDSTAPAPPRTDPWEFIQNHFVRCWFMLNKTGFRCNTINSGFKFDMCYFSLRAIDTDKGFTVGGTGFDIESVGQLIVDQYLAIGNGPGGQNPSDGSTLLKTTNAFNSIVMIGQDENIEWAYIKNGGAYSQIPVIFRNCSPFQSKAKFNAVGEIVFDNCELKTTDAGIIHDSAAGTATIYLTGKNYLENTANPSNPRLTNFVNNYSRVFYPDGNVNEKFIAAPGTPTANNSYINATSGGITFAAGVTIIDIFTTLINQYTVGSTIDAFIRTSNPDNVTVSATIYPDYGFIRFTLSAASTVNLSVGFNIRLGTQRF